MNPIGTVVVKSNKFPSEEPWRHLEGDYVLEGGGSL